MISKSISTSKKLSRVSTFSALLFTWLIPHCDDGGNMDAEPFAVKGVVLPMRPETVEQVAESLTELEKIGLITIYSTTNGQPTVNHGATSEGERFLHIDKWDEHQTLRLDRPDFHYPEYVATNGRPLVNQRSTNGRLNGTELKGTEGNGSARQPEVVAAPHTPEKLPPGTTVRYLRDGTRVRETKGGTYYDAPGTYQK